MKSMHVTLVQHPQDKAEYGIVLVTAASRADAIALAQMLLTAKLAACVNLFPVHSLYVWEGNLETSDEWQLIIKTDLAQFSELETQVRAMHSYDLPEIIAIPLVAGSPAYLDWIGAQVKRDLS